MLRRAKMIIDVSPTSRAQITVKWNRVLVYQGDLIGNIEWDTDAALWGDVDLELGITGDGNITWLDFHMNYTGCLLCLPGSESSGGQRVMPCDFFDSPSVDQDCRHSVEIDGRRCIVERDHGLQGAWHYQISVPAQVRALVRIDRQKTMLWTPVV
jgi:hypothetical protein